MYKEYSIKCCLLGLLVIVLSSFIFGQKNDNFSKIKEIDEKLFKLTNQIEVINDSLLKETPKLSINELILLYANLAKVRKLENPSLSKTYFNKAIAESTPAMNDSVEDKAKKLKYLGELLSFSVQIDSESTKKILKLIETFNKNQNSNNNKEISQAMAQAALSVIKTNPEIGFNLAISSIKYTSKPSENQSINSIIYALASADKNLAEQFLLEVLKYAQMTNDFKTIGNLVSFISAKSFTVGIDFLSDQSKKIVLSVFLEQLLNYAVLSQQDKLSGEQKELACQYFLKSKGLKDTIANYLPDKSAYVSQVTQQIRLCEQAFSSSSKQSFVNELVDDENLTIDELIDAAFEAKDSGKKTFYFSKAIGKLSVQKDFEKVLELLDSMDDETKRSLGISNDFTYWRALRNANARSAILQKLKLDDYNAIKKIIENTPLELRPSLQIAVSREILKNKSENDSSNPKLLLALDLITDARSNLPKIDDSFLRVDLYLSLIHLYSDIQIEEVFSIFQEEIKAINLADQVKAESKDNGKDFFYGRDIIPLPFLEDTNNILYQIPNIKEPFSRIRLKLGLLEATVKEKSDLVTKKSKLISPSK